MKLPVAFAAIDYRAEHSIKKDEVAISFYGGEPLLNFPLIKSCAEYAHQKLKNKEVYFSITTNATLLTPKIANFLFSEKKFSIVVSIDGPKEIHDEFRRDIKGDGSFDRSLKGLKNLYIAFGETFVGRVSLNVVYTPAY